MEATMALFMYQAAYTPESWAAQLKNPQNRAETVGRAVCEAVGGKLVGGWYCFGEYDLVIIADVPNAECMAAIALAIGAGGAVKSAQTTALMNGAEGVAAMSKAASVASAYKPAR
jgi:uncharacterized protein with GYD domain